MSLSVCLTLSLSPPPPLSLSPPSLLLPLSLSVHSDQPSQAKTTDNDATGHNDATTPVTDQASSDLIETNKKNTEKEDETPDVLRLASCSTVAAVSPQRQPSVGNSPQTSYEATAGWVFHNNLIVLQRPAV